MIDFPVNHSYPFGDERQSKKEDDYSVYCPTREQILARTSIPNSHFESPEHQEEDPLYEICEHCNNFCNDTFL